MDWMWDVRKTGVKDGTVIICQSNSGRVAINKMERTVGEAGLGEEEIGDFFGHVEIV